jgi:soluble P-type ATPase
MLLEGGRLLGSIRIADVLRPEAKHAVAAMRRMGLRTILLSGDTQAATTSVGRDLGVDEMVGELLPEQKAKWVRELRGKGRKVAMVGDGINDAPALVEADVGIAMGSGTEVARESADIILIGNDVAKLVETLADCPTLSWHHHAEFRRNPDGGWGRSSPGCNGLLEPPPRRGYTCDFGANLYSKFCPAASRKLAKRKMTGRHSPDAATADSLCPKSRCGHSTLSLADFCATYVAANASQLRSTSNR